MRIRTELWDIGIDWDSGDTWGSAMAVAFGVSHALHHADEEIPGDWEYRDSPICSAIDPDEDYAAQAITETVATTDLTWDRVREIGSVMVRYSNTLDARGLSY